MEKYDLLRIANASLGVAGLLVLLALALRDGKEWPADLCLGMASTGLFLAWAVWSAIEAMVLQLTPGPRIYVQTFATVFALGALLLTYTRPSYLSHWTRPPG